MGNTKKIKSRTIATRVAALEWNLYFADVLKVREQGGNNRGAIVEMIQRADGPAGERYAWCQSLQNASWRLATGAKIVRPVVSKQSEIRGGTMLLGGSASVGIIAERARQLRLTVQRPFRGDHFAMQLTDDEWPDHTGQIVRVLAIVPKAGYLCQTVEGNTGDGSVADGDGVFRRVRFLRSSRTIFYRVPGITAKSHLPPNKKGR